MKYENWSFGYLLTKIYVNIFHRIVHKRIIHIGKKNIPKNKPIVFTPNHQNALSDPLAILLHIPLQPVWLTRADVFKSKVAAAILRFMKMMPVYRIRDGKDSLGKNDQTFANSITILKNNKSLALFPEAAHSGRRHSIAHKKAVPRIVFMAEEKYNFELDIQIVPVGIYYSHYYNFGRSIIVQYGEPIAAKDYQKSYAENQQSTIIRLRDDIRDKLLPLTLDIRSTKYYEAFEEVRTVSGRAFRKKIGLKKGLVNQLKSDQQLVAKLDQLEIDNPKRAEALAKKVRSFMQKVKGKNMRSWVVAKNNFNFLHIVFNKLILLLLFPVFLCGIVLNGIPYFGIDFFVKKKVKDKAFWSSFALVLSMVVFPLFYGIWLAVAWKYLPTPWCKIGFAACQPIAGWIAMNWYILLKKTIGRASLMLLAIFKNKEYQNLINEKQEIIDEVLSL